MRIRYNSIVLSTIAAAMLGAVAFQGLHAQTKPPVYVVNEIDVTDSAGFQKYADAQAQLIQKHGGRYIIRGGKVVTTFDGEPPKRFTIYVFENDDALQAWRNVRRPKSYSQLEVNTASSVHSRSKVSQNNPEHDHETKMAQSAQTSCGAPFLSLSVSARLNCAQ